MFNINGKLLYDAMTYFQNIGYEMISVPYLVDEHIVNHTLPKDRNAYMHGDSGLYYVGSAEQSIYQLISSGVELPNLMMAITPCQRDEPILDNSHLEIFLKIELISLDLGYNHNRICDDVLNFIQSIGIHNNVTTILQDDQVSVDININGVEIGSYGYRWFNDKLVSYGTGLALPRFEYATQINV